MFISPPDLFPAKHIISLVPSQTELLHYLGADVAGITKFCIHPAVWFRTKPRVGGTKTVDLKKIAALSPGLIIANQEENVREQVEELAKHYPVWLTDINDLEDALSMIKAMGVVAGNESKGLELAFTIEKSFNDLNSLASIPAAYLIWKDPYMAAGGKTFINDMLLRAGFRNVFEQNPRYPEINLNDIIMSEASVIMLSSEPYPFKQKHIEEISNITGKKKIILVDGEMFSWYGSRLLESPGYFLRLHQHIESLVL